MLFPAFQLEQPGHHGVGGDETVASVLAVVRSPVVVGDITRRRVPGVDQGHVALTTLDGLGGVALGEPVAGLPVVVLILQLYPADTVDLLVDELLVAGGTVFGSLEHPLGELVVLVGIGADQEITQKLAGPCLRPLPQVDGRLGHDVVGVALEIGLADPVADQAGDALVVTMEAGEVLGEDVLGAGEKRDRIVAAAAVAGRLGTVLLGHDALHLLKQGIHGRVAVGAGLPLLENLGVTIAGSAAVRAGERLGIEASAGRGHGQAGSEGSVLTVQKVVVLGQLVDIFLAGIDDAEQDRHPESRQSHREAAPDRGPRSGPRLSPAGPDPHQQDVRQAGDQSRPGRIEVNGSPGG